MWKRRRVGRGWAGLGWVGVCGLTGRKVLPSCLFLLFGSLTALTKSEANSLPRGATVSQTTCSTALHKQNKEGNEGNQRRVNRGRVTRPSPATRCNKRFQDGDCPIEKVRARFALQIASGGSHTSKTLHVIGWNRTLFFYGFLLLSARTFIRSITLQRKTIRNLRAVPCDFGQGRLWAFFAPIRSHGASAGGGFIPAAWYVHCCTYHMACCLAALFCATCFAPRAQTQRLRRTIRS
jgi:hypothetical protein